MKKTLPLPDYPIFLAALEERILQARTSAARAVNRDLVLLYWDIGRGIVEKQQTAGWGEAVVERLAADLRAEFPDMRGLSANNLWLMRQLYSEYSDAGFLEQLVQEIKKGRQPFLAQLVPEVAASVAIGRNPAFLAQPAREFDTAPGSDSDPESLAQAVRELAATVPWGHHVELLKKVKDPAARIYYIRAIAQLGWSRNVLLNQIKGGAYERAVTERKAHNFSLALPAHFAEQADEMMKSRYNLEFLGIGRAIKERELEDRLIGRLQQFILELGYGFCFIGRHNRLALGRKEYFVDLLFYHRLLKALVAFDLKIGPFEPEHAGKMDFYLNLLNDKERGPGDQPSVGSDQWLVTSGQKGSGQWRVGNGWKPATDHWPLVTKHWPLADAVRDVIPSEK
ncbi:MAG: PDDEXK nuclease domain-containing protein [Acidobacteriota bacterium]|jgi:predicted nuclease of restriction endonuclease-like (RecB) superfamily